MYPITGIAGCCARAASGNAIAAPTSAASNSRRPMMTLIRPSRARCVKGTIPRHERAVFTGQGGQDAGCFHPKADIRTEAETQSTDSEYRPFYSITLRADARGRDGGVRQEQAAGGVLRSGGGSAFGGKPEKHTLVLSLTAFDARGHSEAFTRLAYRP